MAAPLVGLKWRLLVNGLKSDRQRQIGLPLMIITLVGLALWGATEYAAIALEMADAGRAQFSVWVVTLVSLAWIILPVVLFPVDEPLDPSRFSLLPVTTRTMALGLTAAGMVTATIVVPLIFVGANVIVASGAGRVMAVIAGAVILLHMIVGGQAFTTAVSLALRNRRGRDAAFLAIASLGVFGFVAQQVLAQVIGERGLESAVVAYPITDLSWIVPPAAAQRAVVDAVRGDWITAVGHLLVSMVWLLVVVWVWVRMLDRIVTTPEDSPLRTTKVRTLTSVAGWAQTWVIRRKEILYYVRDPRMRLVWTGGVIFLSIMAASILFGTTPIEAMRRSEWMVLTGPAVVLFIGLPIALNQIGWERNAASFLFTLPVRARSLMFGKNLAAAIGLFIEAAVVTLSIALVTGGWRWVPWTLPIAITAIACELAVGNLVSVFTPLRLPPMGSDLFAQATEQGCLALVSQAGSFFITGLLVVPPAVGWVLVVLVGWNPIWMAMASALYGGLIYLGGLFWATSVLAKRIPELVTAVETR